MSQGFLKIVIVVCIVLIVLLSAWIYIARFYPKNKISIYSDVPNISLSLKDDTLIEEFTNSWGLYTKKIILTHSAINPIKVEKIHIILTPTIQVLDTHVGLDGKTVIQSTGHSFKSGVLTIFVYLDQKQILSRDEEEISRWILHSALLRIYSITQNETIDQDTFSKQMWPHIESASQIINVEKS